ncbi:reduced folate transporter [Chanos chanos]|uniref:Reduced folate transporter n=1 Tax=Chanos chanos TaxID=29144 RepID=A0A6J2VVY2_CHACN|nr:reduced folate transporter [Chanos chanos]XP_030637209.1 reduced folate transporter [Chanos chanos]XP_030637210.1 reduced folate transporter [Chanos chanos]XP_030637211.1 reduced folate transporter [Chanos chanos]XP_030637212.1 reduced folate transporter [Chanos chanos]XP_030637213.1 reduced folate transporter [Chanos chanos]
METAENKHEGEQDGPIPVDVESNTGLKVQDQKHRGFQWWSVTFLCFYGFMVQLKPGEPFITPFLLSVEKNFTKEEVTNEINPVLSYSYMAVLVPVFLLTDYLRYKPVLILQSLSHVSIWLLLMLGSSLLEMQFMEFFYGITMAARVAYSSYIFSLVPSELYQRVASFSRSSVLIGVFTSSVLGQICVSFGKVSYGTLSVISLGFVSLGLVLSLFLPWPKRSMFFNQARQAARPSGTKSELDRMKADSAVKQGSAVNAAPSWKHSVFIQMLMELRNVVRVPNLRLWSLWWVFNSTGYYLVLFYVHILWNSVYPVTENTKVYNGGVEAASTLLGAATSFTAGFVKIRWKVWSELVIGIITAVQAGLLLLMGTTDNIWVCYVAYAFFRGFYQFLVPIAIFQIASSLTKELCALVFGVNTFLGTILKSIITLIVADKRGLGLPVHSQFIVYFFYFTFLTITYLACAAWVITMHYRNQRREGGATEIPPTELNPVESVAVEAVPLTNGTAVKD